MQALDQAPQLIERTQRITAGVLAEQLRSEAPPLVIDVRTEREWAEDRIEAAINVPLSRLGDRLAELPSDRPIVVYCASGYRSAIAASMLRHEHADVLDLVGGLSAWNARDPEPASAAR